MQTLSRRSPLVWRLLGCPPPAPPESGLSTVIAVTCRVDRLAAGEEPGRVAVSRRARGALNNALQGLWKRRLDRATDLLLPMAAYKRFLDAAQLLDLALKRGDSSVMFRERRCPAMNLGHHGVVSRSGNKKTNSANAVAAALVRT